MPLPRKAIPKEIADYLTLDSKSPSNLRWTKGRLHGKPAGNLDGNGYYVVRFKRRAYKAHRVVWFLSNNLICTADLIDHIDGNKQNNNPSNLRLASEKTNTWNRKPQKNSFSKYKGVVFAAKSFKKPWRADIKIDGKNITIGTYKTEAEAAHAYNLVAQKYYGEYAYLNTVEDKDKNF